MTAKQVHAVADVIDPEYCNYFTPGKPYPILDEYGVMFRIMDDTGTKLLCLWKNCEHIEGNWRREEEA